MSNRHYLQGALFGFAAAAISASWSVITRLAVTTSLDAWHIAALRFGVAGLLLSRSWCGEASLTIVLDGLGWL